MALPSLYQAGTALLVLVALLEALLYLWNRQRAIEEGRRDGPRHDLDSGRRLVGFAEGRYSRGNYEAAVRICGRARAVLSEARRRAAGTDDRKTGALIDAEMARCAAITEKSVRRFRQAEKGLLGAPDGRLEAQRLVHIEMLLDEAGGLRIRAAEAFSAGNFVESRDLYKSVRAKLNEARRAALDAGSRSYVKLLDGDLAQVQRALASANAWALDGRPVFDTPRQGQVKGVISPYFRREDGSFEPRPR